jgi:hypothetical protein
LASRSNSPSGLLREGVEGFRLPAKQRPARMCTNESERRECRRRTSLAPEGAHRLRGAKHALPFSASTPYGTPIRKALARKCGGFFWWHVATAGGKRDHEIGLTPLEFIARIAALVPPPRQRRHRYYSVLAPNAPQRGQVTPIPCSAAAAEGA